MPPLLSARGLRVALDLPDRPLVVLDGVDLDLAAGTLTVLTGAEGVGFSTLLRVLAGRQAADAGTVTGGPAVLLTQPPGDEWQDDDVVAAVAPRGREALGVDHLGEREMWMLSAGERQRVRLARALAAPEPVLLLDEPFGGLDAASRRTALGLLRDRAAAGSAVLAVARDDERAAGAADRVLTLSGGRLA